MNDNKSLPQPPPIPKGAVSALDVKAAQAVGKALSGAPTPEEKQAVTATEDNNPAESFEAYKERMARERGNRVSLNTPTRRLEVPALPGFHLHWFLERNIPKALEAWYEFVGPGELPTVDRSIGGRTKGTTSDDLGGGRLSIVGGVNEQGLPEQLVLMKCRNELFFADQRKIAERNLAVIQQIFQKKAPIMAPEESQTDYEQRYTREAVIDMSNGRARRKT